MRRTDPKLIPIGDNLTMRIFFLDYPRWRRLLTFIRPYYPGQVLLRYWRFIVRGKVLGNIDKVTIIDLAQTARRTAFRQRLRKL
jgi:hypothetical protein